MLPIGLNMCSPADQELINLAKIRYSLVILNILSRLQSWFHHGIQMVNWPTLQRDTDEEVREFLQNNLHLQGKVLVPRCSVSYQELRGVIKAHSLQYIFPSYVLCCVVDRWTTRPCAGRWPCTRRWQGRPRMPTHRWKSSRECRRFPQSSTTWKWWASALVLGTTEKRWACQKHSSGRSVESQTQLSWSS